MANNFDISNAARTAAADAVVDRLDLGAGPGLLRIYDGAKPAGPDTALGTQVLLAELTFSKPAFGAASNGAASAAAITADAAANATGTATWFRAVDSTGVAVFDGEIGTTGSDINLNSTSISSGAEVSVSSLTYTQPGG